MSITKRSSITKTSAAVVVGLAAVGLVSMPLTASARPAHRAAHKMVQAQKPSHRGGVRYANADPQRGGYHALVSDGPGSGFGFHHNPGAFRIGAAIAHGRQVDAVHSAVIDSAVDSQPHGYGFYGDSVYGNGNGASYGVFNGSDGYGSPYFAGYYGPGDGEDYGVFGHAYTN